MARFDWVRLVCPLFLAAAVANACGGSAVSEGNAAAGAAGDHAADAGGSGSNHAADAGGSGGDHAADAGGSGGDAGRFAIEPGGSGGDAGEGGANPAACPSALPIAGSKCAAAADLGPDGCQYAPPAPDCAPLIATCSSLGSWILRLEPDYSDDTCSPDPESTCPDLLPALGSACRFQGTVCQYKSNSVVVCSLCDTWLEGENGVDCDGAGGAPP